MDSVSALRIKCPEDGTWTEDSRAEQLVKAISEAVRLKKTLGIFRYHSRVWRLKKERSKKKRSEGLTGDELVHRVQF
ncbi:uncharacterized [Tachysurus ichikawai]